jgi:heme exporter protein D
MFGLGTHWEFIAGAYAVSGAVLIALVAWVLSDLHVQRRILRDMDARGIRRRSDGGSA